MQPKKKLLLKTMNNHQSGESLIEFLIVLSIGLFIIAGAYKLLLIGKKEMDYQMAQTDLMQSELIAEYQLQTAVSNVGVASCGQVASLLSYKNLTRDSAARLRLAQGTAVQVFTMDEAEAQALELDKPGSGQAIADTDVLIVRRASGRATLQEGASKDAESIIISNGLRFKADQIIVISDCQHLVSDRITGVWRHKNQQEIELEQPLGFTFKIGAVASHYEFEAYYIGKTLRKNALGKTITALYVQDTRSTRHELIPNLSGLKITAWLKPYQKPGWYQPINTIEDWTLLKGLQITLKLQSEDHSILRQGHLMLSWNE
ncbi:MAG: prepilin-type N-terminal cleavage/methylation domain-containing protein [Gammaproteobacteria bacterium]|nr:prepilin-type N-terminal cleavage/methylation domain-containing protein [Gammaproteobacteria bacterium]